jgi:arginine decarboxylase
MPSRSRFPTRPDLELKTVNRPRDAFFSQFEDIKANDAVRRIATEQITPYPPGIPVILPGERINQEVIDYLLSGLDAGMTLPDPPTPASRRSESCSSSDPPPPWLQMSMRPRK